MRLRRVGLFVLAFVAIVATVATLRVALYGCVADRFGRCIEPWMIADYPLRTALAGLLGLLMAAWRARKP